MALKKHLIHDYTKAIMMRQIVGVSQKMTNLSDWVVTHINGGSCLLADKQRLMLLYVVCVFLLICYVTHIVGTLFFHGDKMRVPITYFIMFKGEYLLWLK